MYQTLPLWPARASAMAPRVDALFIFMIAVTGFFTVMIFTLIFVFAIRYRRSRHPVAVQIEGSNALELTWTLIPFVVFIIMFVWGAGIYMVEAQSPPDSMEIFVVAKQWMWKFEHPEGTREINELHVPVGRDIRLTMISQDVVHSLSLPAFRVKQDVLPGRYTTEWFHPITPGRYHLFCTQYCGTQHSGMIGEVVVMEPAEYQAWMGGGATEGSLAQVGQKTFQQLGCSSCHRSDVQGRGPNLEGVYGHPVKLDDGRTVTADDAYVRESILVPGAKVVAGYQPIMPVFQSIVSEEQLLALMAYIKSLSKPEQTAPGGASAPPARTAPGSRP